MTDTTIANIAIAQVGAERIGSLDDTTKAARVCKDMLPTLKKKVLEAAEWGFATEYQEITKKLTTPPGATAAYQRVGTDVRVIGVYDLNGTPYARFNRRNLHDWRIQRRDIVTTIPDAPNTVLVKFIDGNAPSGDFPASIELCIATYLAAHLALAIQKSKTLYKEKLAEAMYLLEEATGIDAVQGSDEDLVPGRLRQSRVRLGGNNNIPLVK